MSRDSDQVFAHSFADLMAGLAVTFLVIAAIFIVKSAREQEEFRKEQERQNAEAIKARERLALLTSKDEQTIVKLEQLRDRLKQKHEVTESDVEIAYDKNKDARLLSVVFGANLADFPPGQCALPAPNEERLRRVLAAILADICAAPDVIDRITLEGHTDNVPFLVGSGCGTQDARQCSADHLTDECLQLGFQNNVRLSGARAENVFFLARDIFRDNRTVRQCLETRFVVSGRGPVEPRDGDGGPGWEQRSLQPNARDRRVVIKVHGLAVNLIEPDAGYP
jgi:flagellar motor protein MotB